jgi:hypothetical protein
MTLDGLNSGYAGRIIMGLSGQRHTDEVGDIHQGFLFSRVGMTAATGTAGTVR